jgi:hypothetical protein
MKESTPGSGGSLATMKIYAKAGATGGGYTSE